jgi:hypothetical protein
MNKKLTLVSISYNGKTDSRFIMAEVNENGKGANIPSTILANMLNMVGCDNRGATYSIG